MSSKNKEPWPPIPPDMYWLDVYNTCENPPLAVSENAEIYRIKGCRKAYKAKATLREHEFMIAAGDCSVKAHGRTFLRDYGGNVLMNGIIMDLETPLDPTTLDPTRRKAVMDGMISVVLALHQKGIIHGDLKPANMLICSDGKIRLCDFAEARGVSEELHTWEGMTTANYLSPLRTQHQRHAEAGYPPPTIQDDLYGLGLSIWELYTGKMPFKGMYIDDIVNVLRRGGTVDVDEVGDKNVRAVICTYLRYGGARV